jgi:subtilisin family serine protease
MYPAAYPEVIAVSAYDSFGQLADFSNTGPEVDIMAPGVNVISTNIDKGFGICSGTSMAAPHVSGAVALMLALDKNGVLTPADVKDILIETSYGGEINLIGALAEVQMRQ